MAHYFKTSALALTLTLGCHAAFAAEDTGFVDDASAAGVGEIQAGQLAQQKKGVAKDVKEFADMMVKDHTTANNQLKAIAQSKRMEVSADPSVMDKIKTMILDLRSKSFDQAYANNQVKAHEAAITLFQKEAREGKDADLKAFASATLPTLETHLAGAKALAAAHAGDAAKD